MSPSLQVAFRINKNTKWKAAGPRFWRVRAHSWPSGGLRMTSIHGVAYYWYGAGPNLGGSNTALLTSSVQFQRQWEWSVATFFAILTTNLGPTDLRDTLIESAELPLSTVWISSRLEYFGALESRCKVQNFVSELRHCVFCICRELSIPRSVTHCCHVGATLSACAQPCLCYFEGRIYPIPHFYTS